MTTDRTSLIATLLTLRWVAAAGQLAAVACVAFGMGVALPLWPMGAAIGLLLVFNVYASHRVRQGGDAAPNEVFCHIAVDVAVLAFLIGCSGGPANPFTSPKWRMRRARTLLSRREKMLREQAVRPFDFREFGTHTPIKPYRPLAKPPVPHMA